MLIASTLPDLSEVITSNVRRDSVHELLVDVEEDEGDFSVQAARLPLHFNYFLIN